MNEQTCYICGFSFDDFEPSDRKGYEHLCVPCEHGLSMLELEVQWDWELAIYAKRSGRKYDFQQFWEACHEPEEGMEVNKKHLKGLEELQAIYDDAKDLWIEYNKPVDPQQEINFSGLPF